MNKRGVTVLTLGIIITVMAILVASAIPVASNMHIGAQKTKLQAELNQIEVLTSNYIRRNSANDLTPYEWDLSTVLDFDTKQFEGEIITDNKITVYIVDLNKIDAEEVKDGLLEKGPKDRYLYSEQTGRVYYEKGKDFGDKMYYRVPELEE